MGAIRMRKDKIKLIDSFKTSRYVMNFFIQSRFSFIFCCAVLSLLVLLKDLARADFDYWFEIPIEEISVDGDPSDWNGVNPILTDAQGDSNCGEGSDIKYVFLAKDNTYLYWRIDTYSGTYQYDFENQGPSIMIMQLPGLPDLLIDGDVEARVNNNDYGRFGHIWQQEQGSWISKFSGAEYGAVAVIAEGKIPLSLFEGHTYTGIFPYYYSGQGGCAGDYINITEIDIDKDGDGVADGIDNCLDDYNPDQDDYDDDGFGDVCDVCVGDPDNDIDNDNICGDVDNCPNISNPLQENFDNDTLGNACDDDDDNDGLSDEVEVSIIGTDPTLADTDGNGIMDGDEDSDGDSISNAQEVRCGSDPGNPNSKCVKFFPWLMLLLD